MKRLLIIILAVALFVVVAVPVVLWVGSYASLDHDMTHTKETQALERFSLPGGEWLQPRLSLIEAGGNTFRARTAGFGGDRGNVILLHGFPETSAMYEPMMPELAGAGFRVIAFDQRGYSPGMRPKGTAAYTIDNLSADVFAVADAVGFDHFHLVGHDWGAVVGWSMVLEGSPRIKTWSSLSIPHMGAYATAILNDPDQQERSAYVGLLQMPWLPEAILSFNGFAVMRNAIYSQHGGATLDEYLKVFS
jgi:pimeloyl-ACP methyl ester carboxylesterase